MKKKAVIASAVVLLLVASTAIFMSRTKERMNFERPDENILMLGNVASLLMSYHGKHGQFPEEDKEQLGQILLSEFPDNFSSRLEQKGMDSDGKFVDIHGNPVQVHLSDKLGVLLISAGENGKFGDQDDDRCYKTFTEDPNLKYSDLEKQWTDEL
jgi:hypothetical protein